MHPETHTRRAAMLMLYIGFSAKARSILSSFLALFPTSSVIGMIQATLVGFGGSPTALLARADEVIE